MLHFRFLGIPVTVQPFFWLTLAILGAMNTSGIMSDNFNKFQGRLSNDEITYIEALCGPMMARFGYARTQAQNLSSDRLNQLEAELTAQEPWEKPAYKDLPGDERYRESETVEAEEVTA